MSNSVKNKKKSNPMKSGNPAVVAAAKKAAESGRTVRVKETVSNSEKSSGFVPSNAFSTNTSTTSSTATLYKPQKRQTPAQKFAKIFIVVAMLAGLILSSFAGIFSGVGVSPTIAPNQQQQQQQPGVLVDSNGNPIGEPIVGDKVAIPNPPAEDAAK